MKPHWKTEMKYLNAVADLLQRHGYEVKKPTTKHRDLLDVWGFEPTKGKRRRRCFLEIYCPHIEKMGGGIYGVWSDPEPNEDAIEVWMDADGAFYTHDSSYLLAAVGNIIEPIKKRGLK